MVCVYSRWRRLNQATRIDWFIASSKVTKYPYCKNWPSLGLKGTKVTSLVFFDKSQCLYGIMDGKLMYLDGAMKPKFISKIQISTDVAFHPFILRKDKSEKYLYVQTNKNTIQILSNVSGGRLSMFSMIEMRKGNGICDFQPFSDKKLVVITEDGFVCPYTFNENYSKRLKSPKLVLKR